MFRFLVVCTGRAKVLGFPKLSRMFLIPDVEYDRPIDKFLKDEKVRGYLRWPTGLKR
jgi:hypothetical protein